MKRLAASLLVVAAHTLTISADTGFLNSWDSAFAERELMPWLLAKRRTRN